VPTNQWLPARETGDFRNNPLAFLDGSPMDGFTLKVYLGPKNRFGAVYFQLFLQDGRGRESEALLLGLFSRGEYPAYNWIETLFFRHRLAFTATEKAMATSIDLREAGLERPIFQLLANSLPPGGHMMLEYDSPEQEETRLGLERGLPPPATPLGSLLFHTGCGSSFKDWYFAEGGSEGPRKLQGFKPLNQEQASLQASRLAQELETFLKPRSAEVPDPLEHRAIERARDILQHLRGERIPEPGTR
jgi:hypothetical protein